MFFDGILGIFWFLGVTPPWVSPLCSQFIPKLLKCPWDMERNEKKLAVKKVKGLV